MFEGFIERIKSRTHIHHLGLAIGVVLVVMLVGGSIFVWSGYYNVSASRDHVWFTNRLLEIVRDQSIKARSDNVEVPDLSDFNLVTLGARHYQNGCTFCHGRPGEEPNPIVEQMLPSPPNLAVALREYAPEDLFLIIKHGLKYAGMPAWPAVERDDEVWSLVAFIVYLNQHGPQVYEQLVSRGDLSHAPGEGAVEPENDEIHGLGECVSCHGDAATPPVSTLVPSLSGQAPGYLLRALEEYGTEQRESGIMEPVAHALEPEEMQALADYYASLAPVPVLLKPKSESSARGERIARQGVPEADVPPCMSCHAGAAADEFGALASQPAAFLKGQLVVWQRGLRNSTSYGAIMAPIAQRMSPQQIDDVSAYYQSLTPLAGLGSASNGSAP